MIKIKNTFLHIASDNIKEIEGAGYKVLSDGTILGKQGKPLRPRDNGKGYMIVAIYFNGKRKEMLIHRLVATKFLDNPDNLPEVNHLDEIKSHNSILNLQWVTHKQNTNYGTRTKPVLQMDLDGTVVKRWSSLSAATEEGFCKVCICNVCKGKHKTHKGYIWAYDEIKEAA